MTNQLEENLISRTTASIDQKQNAHALETASELAAIDPADAIVWFVKGRAHYSADQFEDALAAFSQAATIKNDVPQVWLMIGYTLIALRRYEEALPSLEYAMSAKQSCIEAVCALAAVHSILLHTAEARGYADMARNMDGDAATKIFGSFHEGFFLRGSQVSAPTKAMIERLIHSLRA